MKRKVEALGYSPERRPVVDAWLSPVADLLAGGHTSAKLAAAALGTPARHPAPPTDLLK